VNRRGVVALIAVAALTGGWSPTPWTIDREVSRIELTVRALGLSRSGHFTAWSGDVAFDPDAPEHARAAVTVRAVSLDLPPAAARRRALGPGFLDAARHPVLRFQLRSLEPLGGDRYTARADLTLKGVTREVVFPVDLRVSGDQAHLAGAFDIDRADYGIGTSGPWNRLVGRQVTVRVALRARRQ
jgi:polyisoprenoid-binding protein YceI